MKISNLLTVSVFVLASTGAAAQFTTNCTRDFWGNVSCETRSSDPFQGLQQHLQQQQDHQARLEDIRMRWEMIRQQCRGFWTPHEFIYDANTYTGRGTCSRVQP